MVDLIEIYIANLMAVVLICIMFVGNRWSINDRIEKRCINLLAGTTVFGCILDALTFTLDGTPGVAGTFLVFGSNGLLFCLNMVVGPAWSALVIHHVRGSLRRYEKILIFSMCAAGLALLVINCFVPIVYHVDENNKYQRDLLYVYYLAMEMSFMLYGSIEYCISKSHGGILKFFPVVRFIIPILIGVVVQTAFYGISTIPPFVAISVCCMINGLQNESIYRDPLTGLYNRAYLDYLVRKIEKRNSGIMTAIMIDLNDFKSINDRFGHKVGDDALVNFAEILRRDIGDLGNVIRYAGDEFVVLLNTIQEDVVENSIERVRQSVKVFNQEQKKAYQLSFAIGYYSIDLKTESMDKLLNEVDHQMYVDKENLYQQNPQMNRRKF